MANSCAYCSMSNPGKFQNISFFYKEIKVTIFKGSQLCANCQMALWIKAFEEYGKKFIKLEDKRVMINWFSYFMVISLHREEKKDDIENALNDILMSLGIFSYQPAGNWEIIDNVKNEGLNPKTHDFYLYFEREEDAIDFARLKFKNYPSEWEIRHIDIILSRRDVLKLKEGEENDKSS